MDTRPNILLIMPDQMRGDCLSIEGHPVLMTPNTDSIAENGVRFTRAYATSASCIPARRSLLTGMYPSSNGMVGFTDGYPITTPTLPQLLRDNGYATVLVGRHMHQSPYEEPYGYTRQILGSTYVDHDDYADFLERALPGAGGVKGIGLSFNGWQAKPWPYSEHLHPTSWVAQQSRQVLAGHDDGKPLFLTASFYAPHPPLFPPAYYMERYLHMTLPPAAIGSWEHPPERNVIGSGVDAHRTVLQGEALRNAQAGYFGLINQLDDQLYWLISDFRATSRRAGRPWVIVFTSDHGEMLGDHYYFRKCEPYEGSSRIPLLFQAAPDLGLNAGLISDEPVCLEDIMPTLLDLAHVAIPDAVDGVNLVPLMKGQTRTARDILHGEHSPCYGQDQAYHFLTDGRMKYIWRPIDDTEQLFDLDHDPNELENLSSRKERTVEVAGWRTRLMGVLAGRPEGFVVNDRLVSGCTYRATLPWLKRC
jgi:arylsulfatase